MTFYSPLYLTKYCEENQEDIVEKIKNRALMLSTYLILLSNNDTMQLEILDSTYLHQIHYPTEGMIIVGIAEGYQEAQELVLEIIDETYAHTGLADIKKYLKSKQNHMITEVDTE